MHYIFALNTGTEANAIALAQAFWPDDESLIGTNTLPKIHMAKWHPDAENDLNRALNLRLVIPGTKEYLMIGSENEDGIKTPVLVEGFRVDVALLGQPITPTEDEVLMIASAVSNFRIPLSEWDQPGRHRMGFSAKDWEHGPFV